MYDYFKPALIESPLVSELEKLLQTTEHQTGYVILCENGVPKMAVVALPIFDDAMTLYDEAEHRSIFDAVTESRRRGEYSALTNVELGESPPRE